MSVRHPNGEPLTTKRTLVIAGMVASFFFTSGWIALGDDSKSLKMTLKLRSSEVLVGEPLLTHITITNVGQTPVFSSFLTQKDLWAGIYVHFEVEADGKTVLAAMSPGHDERGARIIPDKESMPKEEIARNSLRAGQVVHVKKTFVLVSDDGGDFLGPGRYKISAKIKFKEPDEEVTLESEPVSLTVKPLDQKDRDVIKIFTPDLELLLECMSLFPTEKEILNYEETSNVR